MDAVLRGLTRHRTSPRRHSRRLRFCAPLSLCLVVLCPRALVAQDATGPAPGLLVLTVRPSGVEIGPAGPGGETLDEKLARRDKTVRYICLGCVRADGRVDEQPFFPIRTLNAPQLNAALDGQP